MAFDQVARLLRWNQRHQNEPPQNGAEVEWPNISFDDTEMFPPFEVQAKYEESDFHLPPPARNNTPASTPRMLTPSSTTCEADQDTTYFHLLSSPKISAASLDKLRDWIDYPPPFAQKADTTPVYLFKTEFTFAVLMQGLLYAVGKYKALSSEFRSLSHIASYQYGQDMTGWLEEYGLDMEPERICLRHEIESDWWEVELRSVFLRDDEKKLLPRTIVAFARLAEKLAFSNYNMRYGIAALQGDIDVEGLMEDDEGQREDEYEYL
jgi:hypothetical protein